MYKEKSFMLTRHAAKMGNARAQYALGEMWEKGEGTLKNVGQALVWFKKSMRSGYEKASTKLTQIEERYDLQYLDDQIYFVEPEIENGTILVAGEFVEGIIEAVRVKFSDGIRLVILESPGGLLEEGIKLGDFIRKNGLDVYSGYECASACAIAFLSGNERNLAYDGVLLFHGPRVAFEKTTVKVNTDMQRYLSKLDSTMDRITLNRVLEQKKDTRLTNMELVTSGIVTELIAPNDEKGKCLAECNKNFERSENEFRRYWCAAACGREINSARTQIH